MDVFKFLDDAVRGAVSFVHGFVTTSLTLLLHPLVGPTRLWLAHRNPKTNQISPITYLALMLVLVSVLGQSFVDMTYREGQRADAAALAHFLTTGSMASGIIPLLGGAIVGTLVIDALLRMVGKTRLSGIRYEKFVAVSEYEFAFFLLFGVATVLAIEPYFLHETSLVLSMVPFYSAAIVLAVHFYTLLTRRSKYYAWLRRMRRWPKWLRRWFASWRKTSVRQRVLSLLRWEARPWPFIRRLVIAYFKLLLGMALLVPPFAILVAGFSARDGTTAWLLEQQDSVASVTLLELQCDLAGSPGRARAIAWNNSARPVRFWLAHLRLEITDYFGRRESDLAWRPAFVEPRSSDLLRPGEAVEIDGPVSQVASAPSLTRLTLPDGGCRAGDHAGTVRISSEGNALRLP